MNTHYANGFKATGTSRYGADNPMFGKASCNRDKTLYVLYNRDIDQYEVGDKKFWKNLKINIKGMLSGRVNRSHQYLKTWEDL